MPLSYAADRTWNVPEAPTYDWTGFYAGAHIGYGLGDMILNGGALNTQHLSGVLGGVQAGYRRQFDKTVVGAEATVSGLAISGTQLCTNPSFTCTGNYHVAATAELLAGIATGRTLLFAKGGAAYLWADADVDPTYPGYSASTWGCADHGGGCQQRHQTSDDKERATNEVDGPGAGTGKRCQPPDLAPDAATLAHAGHRPPPRAQFATCPPEPYMGDAQPYRNEEHACGAAPSLCYLAQRSDAFVRWG